MNVWKRPTTVQFKLFVSIITDPLIVVRSHIAHQVTVLISKTDFAKVIQSIYSNFTISN